MRKVRCNAKRNTCPNEATHIRDIPNLGESIVFCVDCVNRDIMEYGEDFGWYLLTPERAEEELQYGIANEEFLPD